MVKRGGKKKQAGQVTANVRQGPRRKMGGLDSAAADYARLLADPCNAPLVHPVYAGGEGGILIRFETDFIVFNGATDTCGVLSWTPGAIGINGGSAVNLLASGAVNSATAVTPAYQVVYSSPGCAFLPNNAAAARCVAACMQVYWPGSESNRAGIVFAGNAAARNITNAASSATADWVGNVCSFSSRMPNDHIEVRWRPTDADQMLIDPRTVTPDPEFARRNALVLAVKGIPNTTGVRVRLVAVYEYEPVIGIGIVNPQSSVARSGYTLDDVLNYLDRMGDWANAAINLASYAGVIGVNYANTRRPAIRL